MTPKQTTKERILDAAQAIMLEKSFHSVGLNEILQAEGIPKGSFYHHFESKEQFGVELLRHYVATVHAYKRRMLLSSEPESDPLKRLITYFESNIASLIANEGKCPCLMVKLASEVSESSDAMRQVLADSHQEAIGIMEAVIREGVGKKLLRCTRDPRVTAMLIGDLWTGAMQRATVERNVEPLRKAIAFIFGDLILPPG